MSTPDVTQTTDQPMPLHIRITHQTKALEPLFCLMCGVRYRDRCCEFEGMECGPWLPQAEYERRVALRQPCPQGEPGEQS